MNNTADDITLALSLADEAESLTMPRFTAVDLYAKTRLEDTPLIDAYHEVDVALRRRLALKRPQDTVFDETLRGPRLFAGRHWVVDPLDGRKNFIRGVPVWATLIALMVDGVPTVGVVSAPALHRRWWAAARQGAFATQWTTFTDLGDFPGPHGKTAAATNGRLHNAVLSRFYGTAAVRQTV